MKGLAAKLGLLALALGVALGLAEAALRVVGYEYRPLAIAAGDTNDARDYHLFVDEHFVYDPQAIWRPRPGFGVFNSHGFRGPEVGERNHKLRVVAVGDSNTLGWAELDGANWPTDLGRLLADADIESEVINAGVWGYSSYQGVPRTREALDLEPDIVLISFGSNDAHRVLRSDAEFSNGALGGRRLASALRGLRSAQLLTSVLERANRLGSEPTQRVSLSEYRENLGTMIDDARRSGATPVLLTRPFVGPVLDVGGWKGLAPDYNLATAEVAEERGVVLVDIYSFFKEMDELFADESHFTAEGHRRAAELLFEQLRPLLVGR